MQMLAYLNIYIVLLFEQQMNSRMNNSTFFPLSRATKEASWFKD